ncbi:ClpP/crotonase-like domain-containing protein [Mycena haematopus]|nr:ClpP/crotonase-like domain-containing protein [Mycena haematopus]
MQSLWSGSSSANYIFQVIMTFHLASLLLFALSALAARYPSFGTLQTTNSSGSDLANLIETLQANDTDIRVVVFSSGNPDFFLAHIDINYFLPGYESPLPSQATIAVIEGRTRGIGNEFLMSCDMRFATTSPSVLLAQLETSFGLNPGAGGAMYLAPLIGRGRTFEYVLASKDIDAATAAEYGWINKAFATHAELVDYVDALAARITLFPAAGIAATKRGINADAQNVIAVLAQSAATQAFSQKFLEATHNQSIGKLELNYGQELVELYK